MTEWRFLDVGPTDAPTAFGRMPVQAGRVASGRAPDTLMTTVWSKAHFSVGWFEDVDAVLDLEACRARGVDVVRRPVIGGGTAFYDAYAAATISCFLPRERFRDLDEALAFFRAPFRAALDRLGLEEVVLEGSSDLRWRGKKFGALIAQTIFDCVLVGSFVNLRAPDLDLYLACAHVPEEKFRDKLIKDMRSYIATPEEILGRTFAYEDVRDAIEAVFEPVTGFALKPQALSAEEEIGALDVGAAVTSDEFVRRVSASGFAAAAPAGSRVGFANHKARKLVRAGVALDEAGRIARCMLAGDMHLSPPDALDRMAGVLAGARPAEAAEVLRKAFADIGVEQADEHLGVTPEDFSAAVRLAADDARGRRSERP